jgi:NADH-quinone oxidoreductase subunit N
MMSLFGLADIPPTICFTGKLLIFTAAMEKGYFTLVLIAMVNVVISLYYYLLVVRATYMLESAEEFSDLKISPSTMVLTEILTSVMIAAGIFPTHLIDLAKAAAMALI